MTPLIKKIHICLIGLFLFAMPAFAQSAKIGITFEAPAYYSFFTSDDGEALQSNSPPAGFLGSIEVIDSEIFGGKYALGLGVDYYYITLADKNNKIIYSFTNLHARFPVTFESLTASLGIGLGTTEIDGNKKNNFKKTATSQFFGKIGFNFSEDIELIASLRNVFAQIEAKDQDTLLEAGGILFALGLGIEF